MMGEDAPNTALYFMRGRVLIRGYSFHERKNSLASSLMIAFIRDFAALVKAFRAESYFRHVIGLFRCLPQFHIAFARHIVAYRHGPVLSH